MLTVYFTDNGLAVGDNHCMPTMERIVQEVMRNPEKDVDIFTSTAHMVDALRVLMRRGVIPVEMFRVIVRRDTGEEIPVRVYPSGGMAPIPKGFHDFVETYYVELL